MALLGGIASNHDLISSDLSDFAAAVEARIKAVIVAGANVTLTSGAGTLTIASTGGGGGGITVTDTATLDLTLTGTALSGAVLDSPNLGGHDSAYHLARANHTGTQLAATISDFSEAVDDRLGDGASGVLRAGSGVTITYNDAANTLTLAATGGGGGGSVATDAIWTAKGDIVAATGVGAATVLSAPGSGGVPLLSSATSANGIAWAAGLIFDANGRLTASFDSLSAGFAVGSDTVLARSGTGQLSMLRKGSAVSHAILAIDNNATTTPGQISRLSYMDANTPKWALEKTGANIFRVFDQAGSQPAALNFTSNANTPKVGLGVITPSSSRFGLSHTSATDYVMDIAHSMTGPDGGTILPAQFIRQSVLSPAGTGPSGFTTVGRAIWAQILYGTGGTVGYGSAVTTWNDCVIDDLLAGVRGTESEFAYGGGAVVDKTPTGHGHGRLWGFDATVHTSNSGEVNAMLVNFSSFQNQYHSASPTAAPSTGISITTRRSAGGSNGFHSTLDTYPLDYGLHVHGRSTTGIIGIGESAGAHSYGFKKGIKIGGDPGGIWWDDTASNYSRVQYGVHVEDWGQHGIYVGRRYSGAAETVPFGVYVANNGLLLGAGSPTAAADGIQWGDSGSSPQLYRSASGVMVWANASVGFNGATGALASTAITNTMMFFAKTGTLDIGRTSGQILQIFNQAAGSANPSFRIGNTGTLGWGDGTNAIDNTLSRASSTSMAFSGGLTVALAATLTGGVTLGASLTLGDSINIITGTSVGTKIGTATTQKFGFWNATPIAQPAAYTQNYASPSRTLPASPVLADVAAVLASLINDLKAGGGTGMGLVG